MSFVDVSEINKMANLIASGEIVNKINITASALQPGVYKLRRDKKKGYYLEPSVPKYNVDKKLYGSINNFIKRLWRAYDLNLESVGAIFTGHQGSGKTAAMEAIANVGIEKYNMAVIEISSMQIDRDFPTYIEGISNAMIVFDEFAKVVPNNIQEKMLTIMSKKGMGRMFFISENNVHTVNSYILNRVQRIRYHLEFGKIKADVLEEYLVDNPVTESFKKQLLRVYSKAQKFSMDFLIGLVSEHNAFPEDSIDEIIEVLNVRSLRAPVVWEIVKVEDVKTKEFVDRTHLPITKFKEQQFNNWQRVNVNITNNQQPLPMGPFGPMAPDTSEKKEEEKVDENPIPKSLRIANIGFDRNAKVLKKTEDEFILTNGKQIFFCVLSEEENYGY
jgi:hypothetical protein